MTLPNTEIKLRKRGKKKKKRRASLSSAAKAPVTEGGVPSSLAPSVQWLMAQSQASGDRFHLLFQTGKLLQVSEPLFLVHAGMQSQRHDVQDLEESREAFDAGDTVGKHQAAAWVLHEEIVEIQVFLICLTVDLGLCQRFHCTLIPCEVNDLWFAPHANLLHEKVKFGGFIYFLHVLLMKDSSRSLVYQGQCGRKNKSLSIGVVLGVV